MTYDEHAFPSATTALATFQAGQRNILTRDQSALFAERLKLPRLGGGQLRQDLRAQPPWQFTARHSSRLEPTLEHGREALRASHPVTKVVLPSGGLASAAESWFFKQKYQSLVPNNQADPSKGMHRVPFIPICLVPCAGQS
jgi:hypothetical protein